MGFLDRLVHGWNAFNNRDDILSDRRFVDRGSATGVRPDRLRSRIENERSLIVSIMVRIAVDVASADIRHVRLQDGRYIADIDSGLANCLNVEANLDQDGRAFIQDMAYSLMSQGDIAVVPVETDLNPMETGGYNILQMRVGTIVQWYPKHVRVRLYNDDTGRHEEITLEKKHTGVMINPFYEVMNERNSILQRVISKLQILDVIDQQSGSGKLDLIVQLPYVIKDELRQAEAEGRRKDIEVQLKDSKYGIAYTDGTEKITQLNRPVENNLLKQVEYLMELLYGQLGITKGVMDGTADEATMINYNNRTVKVFLDTFVGEFRRKFLTKTARTQGQSVEYYKNPFELIPISQLAEIVDKFTRSEVLTSNEIRQFMGIKPSTDPQADSLRNPNMPQRALPPASGEVVEGEIVEEDDPALNRDLDALEAEINRSYRELGMAVE